MDASTRRIVVLGKTGAGKSSLANTLLGEDAFEINHYPVSGTIQCQSKSKTINGKSLILIDTPGFFDTDRSEEDLKPDIVRCITECAPGPHVFLIVLKVEKFTQQEKDVVKKVQQYFAVEALKYAIVLFTHGDQLPEPMKIEELVIQSEDLQDLVSKCGGRCHVIDNKYWKNNRRDEYRNNQFQVTQLLNTIDEMTKANKGGCYTTEMLQAVNREKEQEQGCIKQLCPNISPEELRRRATDAVFTEQFCKVAGVSTAVLLGGLLGGALIVGKLLR